MQAETPLMTFWRGLCEECDRNGIARPTFGPVRRLFQSAVEECRRDADKDLIDAIRAKAA